MSIENLAEVQPPAPGDPQSPWEPLEHGDLPDPEGQEIEDLKRRVGELEALLKELRQPHR